MALQQVNKVVADGSSSTLICTGIDDNSVYALVTLNANTATSNKRLYLRVSKSSSLDSSSNYRYATQYQYQTNSSFTADTNEAVAYMQSVALGYTDNVLNEFAYLYDFHENNTYPKVQFQRTMFTNTNTYHRHGMFTLAERETCDGIGYATSGGNVASGTTLVLYKVV